MKRPACLRFVTAGLLLAVLLAPRLHAADQRLAPAGRTWVLLIGVNKYEKVRRLKFCVNDVKQLAATFKSVGGLPEEQVKTVIDEDGATICASIRELLGNAEEGDTVIVFFSGHGFVNAPRTEVVLAACDFDQSTDLGEAKGVEVEGRGQTGIALSRLRTALMGCKATHRLLLLDACFSGAVGEDSEAQAIINPQPAGSANDNPPDKARGVYCIASCMSWERSIDDPRLEMGRFTYWMNQGLRGGADLNADGEIRADELFEFTYERLKHAQQRLPERFRQEASRFVTAQVHGTPPVLKLQPRPMAAAMDSLAEMLKRQIEHCGEKFEKVEVREFASPHGFTGKLGLKTQKLLEERLPGNYASEATGAEPRTGQAATMASIGGTVRRCSSAYLIQGSLKQGEQTYAIATVAASRDHDTDSEAGDSGCRSPGGAWLDGPHPVADPEIGAKYGVRIFVADEERPQMKVRSIPGKVFVGLCPGENYKVRMYNQTKQAVFVRVFVDGLNTRGARYELPSKARYWQVDAQCAGELNAWTLDERMEGGKLVTESRAFRVTGDIRRAPAWQAAGNDTGNIGQITVMFYERNTHAGTGNEIAPVATDYGSASENSYRLDATGVPTKLLATYTIHYVHPDALASPAKVSEIPTR